LADYPNTAGTITETVVLVRRPIEKVETLDPLALVHQQEKNHPP